MLLIILSWIICFLTFTSFGELFILICEKSIKKEIRSEYNFLDKFWIGIMFITILSILINFFAPLNLIVLFLILCTALILNIWLKIPLNIFRVVSTFWHEHKYLSICFLVIILIILFYSFYPNYLYDTGLYHTQTMKWYQQYPIVPGLGNLHGRLAFNSTTLLIYELFNYQLGIFNTFTSISSLCFLVFAAWGLNKVSTSTTTSGFYLALIIVLFLTSFSDWMPSYNTDLLSALLIITLMMSFIFSENRWNKPIVFICLPLLCITFKLSTVPMCLFSLIYFIAYIKKGNKKLLVSCILFGSCLIIPWIGRFVIETGYLIYPFHSIDIFSFDWKIPIGAVELEKASVVSYARKPNFDAFEVAALPIEDWIKAWYFKVSSFNSMFILLTVLSPILSLAYYKKSKFNNAIIICWLIACTGFIFSFFTAPTTRFHYGFVIMSGTLPFLLLNNSRKYLTKAYYPKIYFASFLLIVFILLWVFKLCVSSIVVDSHVRSYLFHIGDWGFIETRPIAEFFLDMYLNKVMGFGILFIFIIILTVLYTKFQKIKDLFLSTLTLIYEKRDRILLIIYSFALLISFLTFRQSYLNSEGPNIAELLITPKGRKIQANVAKFHMSPDQFIYYPVGTDRCFDCDLPCASPYYDVNLEMRGSKLSDGFRIKNSNE